MSLYRKLKVRTHQIISPAKKGDRASLFFDIFISVLILISCISVFIEILNEGERLHHILSIIEYVSVAVFIVEYLLRMWVCDLIYPKAQSKLRAVGAYVVSFESFVDIVSIVSVVFVLIPKGFALLRLIKLIRLGHAMKLTEYIPFFHKNKDRFAKVQNRVHLILSKHGH